MSRFDALVSRYRRQALDYLFTAERRAVESALVMLEAAWPVHDDKVFYASTEQSDRVADRKWLIAELSSDDRNRQRAALASPKFIAFRNSEDERLRTISGMYYFRQVKGEADFRLRAAQQAVLDDRVNLGFYHGLTVESGQGAVFRARHFPDAGDDATCLELAKLVASCLTWVSPFEFELGKFGDPWVRRKLMEDCASRVAKLSDREFEPTLDAIECAAHCKEPDRFVHYFDIFRQPGWKDPLIAARKLEKEKQAVAQAKAEEQRLLKEQAAAKEAARVAAEREAQVARQLSLSVIDNCLDVSPGGWPELPLENYKRLLTNMRAAFQQAAHLRSTGLIFEGEDLGAVRAMASMSAKQLACVKMAFWTDRTGLTKGDRKYLSEEMFDRLNCDDRAQICNAAGQSGRSAAMLRVVREGMGTDIETEWSNSLNFLQKHMDSEKFLGELARWFVEDKDDNHGWAASR